jgi:hypothetical protein
LAFRISDCLQDDTIIGLPLQTVDRIIDLSQKEELDYERVEFANRSISRSGGRESILLRHVDVSDVKI